ncbi:MAG: hypothetical protein IT167_01225 [Bryobacterales bacterium]|nr:hypothetical protein [Bryobacterales bacterium]
MAARESDAVRIWHKILIAIAAAAVSFALFINYCGLVYQCGCTWLWAGAADHCNIHTAGRHCPWCALSQTGQNLVLLSIIIPQLVVCFWPAAWSWPKRVLLTFVAFPIAGLVPAITLGLWTGYWN